MLICQTWVTAAYKLFCEVVMRFDDHGWFSMHVWFDRVGFPGCLIGVLESGVGVLTVLVLGSRPAIAVVIGSLWHRSVCSSSGSLF